MTLPVPQLDDRTFGQLVDEARRRASLTCPDWTDLSAHDPGVTLLEVFAYLTETMLYRLNRLPEKAYVEFLNLLGVQMQPPSAAAAAIEVRRRDPATSDAVRIPSGTRITVATPTPGEAPPVFTTTETAVLAAGAESLTVMAHHCELIDAEKLGPASGLPGQTYTVARPPIVRTAEITDIVLGVSTVAGELADDAPAREVDGTRFALWQPVTSFAGVAPDDRVYVLDRTAGRITFAPAVDLQRPEQATTGARLAPTALAAVPAAGRDIRVWYRTGGGTSGNVAPGSLTALQSPLPLTVTNPEAAKGGRPAESLENVVRRGPQEFFTLRRAVTARDYELLACQSSGAVARARTLTRAEVWAHASPGEAEVVLVPDIPEASRAGGVTLDLIHAQESEDARRRTAYELDLRKPLGTSCLVTWADYKPVSVIATIVVRAEEDADAVATRVTQRLYDTINPLPAGGRDGWPFGEPLRASNLYRLIEESEPGVLFVEDLEFVVDEAPDGAIAAVAADRYQQRCWFAGSGPVLFRSTGDVDGWEPARHVAGEQVVAVRPYPNVDRPGITPRPGLLAVATRTDDGAGSGVYVSEDLGETWTDFARFDQRVTDVAWTNRNQVPVLLMTTDNGLYDQALLPGSTASQVLVEPNDPDLGFYGITTFMSPRGEPCIALVAQAQSGVYLSLAGGAWQAAGLTGVDTRAVTVQLDGPTTTLWIAVGEPDRDRAGSGAFRARLFETDVRWEPLATGWTGGTCWAIRFLGATAVAATNSAGILRLDTNAPTPSWEIADINCGLPLRDRPRFEPVTALATDPDRDLVLAGGPRGVHLSVDRGRLYQPAARRTVRDRVTIPDTWLLCSSEHRIEVVKRDAAPSA